jgi:hypothetical protein
MMSQSKTIEIGLAIEHGKLKFIGVEEINRHISEGWSLSALSKANVNFLPKPEREQSTKAFEISGWVIQAVLVK